MALQIDLLASEARERAAIPLRFPDAVIVLAPCALSGLPFHFDGAVVEPDAREPARWWRLRAWFAIVVAAKILLPVSSVCISSWHRGIGRIDPVHRAQTAGKNWHVDHGGWRDYRSLCRRSDRARDWPRPPRPRRGLSNRRLAPPQSSSRKASAAFFPCDFSPFLADQESLSRPSFNCVAVRWVRSDHLRSCWQPSRT